MSVSYDFIKREVEKKIRRATILEFLRYSLMAPQPALWSYPQNREDFIEKTIYIMFYKAIEGIGYGELRQLCFPWYGTHTINQKSYQHNVQVMRASLLPWSQDVIVLGSIEEWEDLGRTIRFNNEQIVIHLIADSADFKTIGPPGAGGKKNTFYNLKNI